MTIIIDTFSFQNDTITYYYTFKNEGIYKQGEIKNDIYDSLCAVKSINLITYFDSTNIFFNQSKNEILIDLAIRGTQFENLISNKFEMSTSKILNKFIKLNRVDFVDNNSMGYEKGEIIQNNKLGIVYYYYFYPFHGGGYEYSFKLTSFNDSSILIDTLINSF